MSAQALASARRVAVTVGVGMAAVFGATACSIQQESSPRDIPIDDRGRLDNADPGAGEATGANRVFLITDDEAGGERLLRSVLRDVDATPPSAVLEELIKGPNVAEQEAGMRSDLPADLTLLSPATLVAGTLNVNMSATILELPGTALRYAVAQIVFTASELDGVRSVRLRVDGDLRAWPNGSGELQTTPLTVYDFPGLAESAQPAYPAVPTAAAG